MLLVIDIGNTNLSAGVFDGERLVGHWRVATVRHATADELALQLRQLFAFADLEFSAVTDVVLASVVPPLTSAAQEMALRYCGTPAKTIGAEMSAGLRIGYDNPLEVGADRIANAIAAFEEYGGPAIVVDFGTATTVDAITADGVYLGGAIAPGIRISCDALFQAAARLPRVDVAAPPAAIGRNTVHSVQSGVLYGYVGLVKELVERFRQELGDDPVVLATGGYADLVAEHAGIFAAVDPLLTLKGLRYAHQRLPNNDE